MEIRVRRKPMDMEAFQWTGKPQTYPSWIEAATLTNDPVTNAICMEIVTPEGTMLARTGDWIVSDGKSLWPVKPDYFAANYEII